MDYWLGRIIDDYTLYRIVQGIIVILSMFTVYLGIQVALMWKFMKKNPDNPENIISQKGSFIRSSIYITMLGLFMLVHEFFEGLEDVAADDTTYELFELIAFLGLTLFLYEWYKILKKFRTKPEDYDLSRFDLDNVKRNG